MFLEYFCEVSDSKEGFWYEVFQYNLVAASGSIPYVNSLMYTESGLPAEGLSTLSTLVWFLSCMDSQM
jgi:hypothetical protein